MKKILTLFTAGVLMRVLCVPLNDLSAQTTWDYPVRPGTPEWATFTTHDEMVEACQIPEGVLSSLTTKELVEICLNYPLAVDLYAYNSLQDGLRNNLAVNFNGIQELFRRQDNAQCMLDVLKDNDLLMLLSRKNISTASQIGESFFRHSFMEVLLSHELVIANANSEQQKEIARIAMKSMIIKEGQHHLYSRYSLEGSVYLLCASLTAMNGGVPLSTSLDKFLKDGEAQELSSASEELKRNFIKF